MFLSELYEKMQVFGNDEVMIKKAEVITYNQGVLINDERIHFGWNEYFEKTRITDGNHTLKIVKTAVFPNVEEKEFKFSINKGNLVSWERVS